MVEKNKKLSQDYLVNQETSLEEKTEGVLREIENWKSLCRFAENTLGNSQGKSEPMMLTITDHQTMIEAIKHYMGLCQPDQWTALNDIYYSAQKSHVVKWQDIPMIRFMLNEVLSRYIIQKSACDKSKENDELKLIYTTKINAINEVLSKI